MTRYNTNFSGCFPFSDKGMSVILAANTASTAFTVPGASNQIYRANFSVSASADVWVSKNGTAVIPTGTVTATINQERINPFDSCRYVKGGDTLSFISTGTPQVGVSLLLVQET